MCDLPIDLKILENWQFYLKKLILIKTWTVQIKKMKKKISLIKYANKFTTKKNWQNNYNNSNG